MSEHSLVKVARRNCVVLAPNRGAAPEAGQACGSGHLTDGTAVWDRRAEPAPANAGGAPLARRPSG
ncbi:hypothetical protein GCM10010488_23400 [Oerskovia jenensis]